MPCTELLKLIEGFDMEKKEDKNQLKLLKNDDFLNLLRNHKKFIMKKAGSSSRPALGQLFENCIDLEESAVLFGLAPQTVLKGLEFRNISPIRRRYFFQKRSVQEWFNHKEESQWQ